MISTLTVRPRYAESDQMGFIHHSAHIIWMEQARMEWLKTFVIDYRRLEERGLEIPVLSVQSRYLSPVFYDEPVLIETACTSCRGACFRLDYRMKDSRGGLVCLGYSEHCFILRNGKKPVKIPSDIRNKLTACREDCFDDIISTDRKSKVNSPGQAHKPEEPL